jgi:hypothetical protein
MITEQAHDALVSMQRRARNTADSYSLDRIDRALDEISRNLGNDRPAPFQTRSAYANAGKVIASRRLIAPTVSLDRARDDEPASAARGIGADEDGYAVVELLDWLRTSPSLTPPLRRLIVDLSRGEDALSLASKYGVPVARIRERISRARAAARAAYLREVFAA